MKHWPFSRNLTTTQWCTTSNRCYQALWPLCLRWRKASTNRSLNSRGDIERTCLAKCMKEGNKKSAIRKWQFSQLQMMSLQGSVHHLKVNRRLFQERLKTNVKTLLYCSQKKSKMALSCQLGLNPYWPVKYFIRTETLQKVVKEEEKMIVYSPAGVPCKRI